MLFKHVDFFLNRSTFYSSYRNLWIVENYFPINEKLNIISSRKRAKKKSPPVILALCKPQYPQIPKSIN